ncbi:small ribosomal subunit protein uS10m [Lissotriton helveticus]
MFAAVCGVLLRGLLPRQQLSCILPLSYSAGHNSAVYSSFQNPHLLQEQFRNTHSDSSKYSENPLISISENADTLYKQISVLVKGHDKTVLDSYEYFAVLAAKELGISIDKVYEPPRKIERLTLLKSIHIYKKHRVQYEMRTHYRCMELKHLTGSTADVYLEYIQRNVPEGVALEIKKTTLEKLPEHLKKPVWDSVPPTEECVNAS